MARVNIYLPDELADEARDAGLNVSGLAQQALRDALDQARTDGWIARAGRLRPTGVSRRSAAEALAATRDEFDRRG